MPPVTRLLVLPLVSHLPLQAQPHRTRPMPCATPRLVPRQPTFLLRPRARIRNPRPMLRATLRPTSPLESRLSQRASLPRSLLTAPATRLLALPLLASPPPLRALLQRTRPMRLATSLTVFLLPPFRTLLPSRPTQPVTSPRVPRQDLLRRVLMPLAMLQPALPLRRCPFPMANGRRSRSTRCAARLPFAPPRVFRVRPLVARALPEARVSLSSIKSARFQFVL